MKACFTGLLVLLMAWGGHAAEVALPKRAADAVKAGEFAQRVSGLDRDARERTVKEQILAGNVPDFWRTFAEVKVSRKIGDKEHTIIYHVAPDYIAIGADQDYLLMPLTPATAQSIADELGCILPTRQMVNDIHAAAPLKMLPMPIAPSSAMTSVTAFVQHNEMVRGQRMLQTSKHRLGTLVGGHKKDVVLTPRLAAAPGKVAIYGWQTAEGKPIQPLYLGHTDAWVDYSHGIRFVRRDAVLDGKPTTLEAVLADPQLSALLSDEGPILEPRYGKIRPIMATTPAATIKGAPPAEENTVVNFDPGVRSLINAPVRLETNKPVNLVLYALPNGNTIEQTIGKKIKQGDDWHFDIQHIGAQTRWLRVRQPDIQWVIVYLESSDKAWPLWRRKNDPENKRVPEMVEALRKRFARHSPKLVLTGHSGGGSFTFGYLNGIKEIPADVERIAFLDSNYAYDPALGHADKLSAWLNGSRDRYLCVLAYHDSIALLNGKTFVSESGGTWGRSLAMLKDLGSRFPIKLELTKDWQRHTALDGRVKFFLKENPTKAVLHTRQVEWNGFIHAMLSGTGLEGKDYEYMGPRAYADFIAAE